MYGLFLSYGMVNMDIGFGAGSKMLFLINVSTFIAEKIVRDFGRNRAGKCGFALPGTFWRDFVLEKDGLSKVDRCLVECRKRPYRGSEGPLSCLDMASVVMTKSLLSEFMGCRFSVSC